MRIAFVGKGGSGKTTLTALVARYLARLGTPVLAIDADINQHLALSLGATEEFAKSIPPLGIESGKVKDFLRGKNPRLPRASSMIKTTPPGSGSELLSLKRANPLFDYFVKSYAGINILATGPFTEEDLGIKCYHSKVGAAEMVLNHLIDGKNEYVLIDMTAGADSFASGMFTKFDLTLLVVEPTLKSLTVYEQYKRHAKEYGVFIKAIANKIESEEDMEFLLEKLGSDLLGVITYSRFIRSLEKGVERPFEALEPENLRTLEEIKKCVDSRQKDWGKFYRESVEFHLKNGASWANATLGEDVSLQIDPEFDMAKVAAEL